MRALKRWEKCIDNTFDPVREVTNLMNAGFTQTQALAVINCIANFNNGRKQK
jgi:hypothetical protein